MAFFVPFGINLYFWHAFFLIRHPPEDWPAEGNIDCFFDFVKLRQAGCKINPNKWSRLQSKNRKFLFNEVHKIKNKLSSNIVQNTYNLRRIFI